MPAATPSATPADEKTVAFRADEPAQADFGTEKTVVLPPSSPAEFDKTVVTAAVPDAAQPGYDATQKMDAISDTDPFAKTAVISRSGAGGAAADSGNKTDTET